MKNVTLVISFSTYSDWSPGDDPGEVDVHTEDTDSSVVGCASSPEEAARLISAALAARAPSDDKDGAPGPLDVVTVDAVRPGSPLGEAPLWHAEILPLEAEEYDRCLATIVLARDGAV